MLESILQFLCQKMLSSVAYSAKLQRKSFSHVLYYIRTEYNLHFHLCYQWILKSFNRTEGRSEVNIMPVSYFEIFVSNSSPEIGCPKAFMFLFYICAGKFQDNNSN
jgi:hypothetical protein